MDPTVLLSLIVFLPAIGGIILMLPGVFSDDNPYGMRWFTLFVTIGVFVLSLVLVFGYFETAGEGARQMQNAFNLPWIPSFNIDYYMGVDGISLPLIVLTTLISMLAMGASWTTSISKHVKAYCVLFLLLETGMLGVFVALDFFLFYVFWEVMLLPMYFLIGVWGGPRREYAAIKFFLYTLVGSVLMLVAILIIYFNSDMRELALVSDRYAASDARVTWDDLHVCQTVEQTLDAELLVTSVHGLSVPLVRGSTDAGRVNVQFEPLGDGENVAALAIYDEPSHTVTILAGQRATKGDIYRAIADNPAAALVVGPVTAGPLAGSAPIRSFNMLALAAMAQHTDCFSRTLQHWCFWLLFIGFIIKVPSVPVHTWLPDAHVEAPTPISMILAGVLLKMGGYGIIRICYPICPWGGYDFALWICLVGLVSMVYGAFAAMAQKDFKRLVAYSSVSHMGYVVLGMGVWSMGYWSVGRGIDYNWDYWNMGVQGAMFQMIGHGISSAGMFFMVGIVYDRVHHRNIDDFGGLFGKMPVYTALSIGIFFAALGLPGLCGFIGEVLVVLSVWKFNIWLAVISAAVVILTAAYILWTIQRVYLGVEYRGPHEEELKPIKLGGFEFLVAAPLFVLAIVLGVLPYHTVLRYMDPSVERQVQDLAQWTQRIDSERFEMLTTRDVNAAPTVGAGSKLAGSHVSASLPDSVVPATELFSTPGFHLPLGSQDAHKRSKPPRSIRR